MERRASIPVKSWPSRTRKLSLSKEADADNPARLNSRMKILWKVNPTRETPGSQKDTRSAAFPPSELKSYQLIRAYQFSEGYAVGP